MRLPDGRIRKLREVRDVAGEAHELTFSCFRRLPLLARDRTRRWFVEALDAARRRDGFELWAYVIMPEHAHVLLFPTEATYSTAAIRTAIKQSVARKAIAWLRSNNPKWLERLRFVWSNGKVGYHFWQPGGGYDRNIVREDTAWAAVEYIHNNPVRRGLVTTPTDWPWSSARWYACDADCLLAMDATPSH
jgi:putative transposase